MQAYHKDYKSIVHSMLVEFTIPGLTFLPVFGKSGNFRVLLKEFKKPKEVTRAVKKNKYIIIF